MISRKDKENWRTTMTLLKPAFPGLFIIPFIIFKGFKEDKYSAG
jgi:hypothetical protein